MVDWEDTYMTQYQDGVFQYSQDSHRRGTENG